MRPRDQPAFGAGLTESILAHARGRGRVHVIVGGHGGKGRLDSEGVKQIAPEKERPALVRRPDAYMPGGMPGLVHGLNAGEFLPDGVPGAKPETRSP